MAHDVKEAARMHHPSGWTYVKVGALLTIITAVEVATYYIESIHFALVYILIPLSVLKFVIVVGYYMHLKFDNKLFSWIFGLGMLTAVSVVTALIALFDRF